MRIDTIRLDAYGPFTGATIDLSAEAIDFHLIFGPNEAGKSSTLRALRHMLFGIPVRTGDNFLHAYPHLRIGARLVRSDGEVLEFVRRKGQSKTLRGADDETVLDDDSLAVFLGGVTQELFEQMFAIGHDDLIRGGEEIIAGRGRIGEALFAAGAGLIRLQHVQQALDQACGALFKPSGSTPVINQTIAALKAVRKTQKESLLPAKTWQDHDRCLNQARQRMAQVRTALADDKQQLSRLKRIQEALPLIARKKELDGEWGQLAGVPDLADGFGEQRRDAERELGVATRDLAQSRARMEEIGRQMAALNVPEAMLAQSAAIEALQHELGSYRKARKDRPGLQGRMRTLETQAAGILASVKTALSGESTALADLPPSIVGEIQNLGARFERLSAKLESATGVHRKLKARLARSLDQRQCMPMPDDVSGIETVLQDALNAGPAETLRVDLRQSLDALAGDLKRRLARQTLWQGDPEDVDALPLPSGATIDRFDQQLTAASRRIEKAQETRQNIRDEIEAVQVELRSIDIVDTVPTDQDLTAARATRDQGWGLVRRCLDGHPAPADETAAFCRRCDDANGLPDAFETTMARADHIADRLRREADQVSRKGLLEARRGQLDGALGDAESELAAAETAAAAAGAAWQKLWASMGIIPLSVAEMRAWMQDMASLFEKLATYRADHIRYSKMTAELAALKSRLNKCLAAAGVPVDAAADLPALIRAAQAHVQVQQARAQHNAAADQEISHLREETADAAAEVEALNTSLSHWRDGWQKNVRKIGLDADASPTAALAVIDSLREARTKSADAEVLQKRIDGIDRDSATFARSVARMIADLAPDLTGAPCDRAAEQLYSRLTAARTDASRRQSFSEQLENAGKGEADAKQRIGQCQALLDTLCREAGCEKAEALAETEQRARRRRDLFHAREDLDDQLRRLSAGATVDQFTAEAMAVDADSIGTELEKRTDRIETLEQERSQLDQTIGIETAELARMDGSAAAADHAESAQRLLARLEADVEQFARLKIAGLILARTVEQYRDKHQGPLIARASELFTQMTLGAFDRLRADYDEKGNPILVGIRAATAAPVNVDGMSDGTADQLYLALRLASLEQYLENNEPLPFIVDDILLRFDDDRALATLKILADLSTKTQVLFFTHHQHLVNLAKRSTILGGAFNCLALAE
ncbi:hypothetical protein DSCO28_22830 [Desulfosarcina ovata subsp. sediminis]|uniref:YhaN AAA domain-containing protein n=1 Tax=Desulfosarcina ovata subsp. sediminis TaxID=885957 RepID=A0A5K7ZN79_9BACT|nr:YhaN family protein [Desulfosarcina ovata]BBO81717.1 hypothetical protein DSCO28_22830 [Desulfosarcina ovata subsp. sediminis]